LKNLKCRRCGKRAVIDIKAHHTAFCRDCFILYVHRQVRRAIAEYRMFSREDKILVCVSGGKDSLALWDILLSLGYECHGLHLDLGIDGYSERSRMKAVEFAQKRGCTLRVISMEEMGIPVPKLAKKSRRPECSVCGTVKRHFFNKAALEGGYKVVATGHNLDDEAARLLGNILHWQWEYLAKQRPVLPPVSDLLVRKVEPLCRLSERESAAYAILTGIDYILEECPMSKGATSIRYKHALNILEDSMPGAKMSFYTGFIKNLPRLSRAWEDLHGAIGEDSGGSFSRCSECGSASFTDPCNFCRLTIESGLRPR
jgi:uncharacterized protein (TIGR00269 family)